MDYLRQTNRNFLIPKTFLLSQFQLLYRKIVFNPYNTILMINDDSKIEQPNTLTKKFYLED